MTSKLNLFFVLLFLPLLVGCTTGGRQGDFFCESTRVVLISLVDKSPGQSLTVDEIGFEIVPVEAYDDQYLSTDYMLDLEGVPLVREVTRMKTLMDSDFPELGTPRPNPVTAFAN